MKSVILLGTSRPDGNTHSLAKAIARQLACEICDLGSYQLSPFDYSHNNRDDDFLPLFRTLVEHEHIALATPVYWYSPSAQMKVFLDRLSDLLTVEKDLGRLLRGKSVSTIATGSDPVAPNCFNDIFERTAGYLGMEYRGGIYCSCPGGIDLQEHSRAISNYISRINSRYV